jgi:hypothetical protein
LIENDESNAWQLLLESTNTTTAHRHARNLENSNIARFTLYFGLLQAGCMLLVLLDAAKSYPTKVQGW